MSIISCSVTLLVAAVEPYREHIAGHTANPQEQSCTVHAWLPEVVFMNKASLRAEIRNASSPVVDPKKRWVSVNPRDRVTLRLPAGDTFHWFRREEPEHVLKVVHGYTGRVRSVLRDVDLEKPPPPPPPSRPCRDELEPSYCRSIRSSCSTDGEYAGYMATHCAKTCDLCHLHDPSVRCTHVMLNTSAADDAWVAAEAEVHSLSAMFEGLEARWARTHPHWPVTWLHASPPIVRIDGFLSENETNALATEAGLLARSKTAGATVDDAGVQAMEHVDARTSQNAWCSYSACERHPDVSRVIARIEHLVALPRLHFEMVQVLPVPLIACWMSS